MNHLKTIAHVCIKSSDLARTAADASLHHYCLETDDMAAVRQRFVDRGFEPGEIKLGADPSGVPFEFHQYTGKSAQFDPSNRDVAVDW